MGVLSNRIKREDLKAGDHIYSWRAAWAYAHHGVYVGDDRVIHFTPGRGREAATGTVVDLLFGSSSVPRSSTMPCLVCDEATPAAAATETNGVRSSCLICFLAGGDLYRFEYAVSRVRSRSRVRGGTCSPATADPDEEVVRRANKFLANGFGDYSLVNNNCEHFATCCKTGGRVQRSGQVVSTIATTTTIIFGLVIALPVYFLARLVRDSQDNREEEADEEQ